MRLETFLVAAMLIAPELCRAANAAELTAINASFTEITAAFDKTEQCTERESGFKTELAKKKADLAAEFHGQIPVVFTELLWQKTARINKQHALCVQISEQLGRLSEDLALAYRSIEPKSANLKHQMELVEARKKKLQMVQPTSKPKNKTPAPKTEPQ